MKGKQMKRVKMSTLVIEQAMRDAVSEIDRLRVSNREMYELLKRITGTYVHIDHLEEIRALLAKGEME